MKSKYKDVVEINGLVGDDMKGLIQGKSTSWVWEIDENGEPHHNEVDRDGGLAHLSNINGYLDFRAYGYIPLNVDDILKWFKDYSDSSEIKIEAQMNEFRDDESAKSQMSEFEKTGIWKPSRRLDWTPIFFEFYGTVRQLKNLLKRNPIPSSDGPTNSIEWDELVKAWIRATKEKSGQHWRGGRDDVWQEKDEDTSKGFSVYNNPPKLNAAFWKWFGDSKVVDKHGNPLVVYHGSSNTFNAFKHMNRRRGGLIYFSRRQKDAMEYARNSEREHVTDKENSKPVIYSVYLRLENPFDSDNKNHVEKVSRLLLKHEGRDLESWIKYLEVGEFTMIEYSAPEIKQAGFDGALVREWKDDPANKRDFAVFKPSQIKSATGNDGTWDADDADIRSNPSLETQAEKILRRDR